MSNLPCPARATSQREVGSAAVDPLLTAKDSAALLDVAVSTLYRYVANGLVPKPLKLGGTSRWPQSEILGVIETARAARDLGAKGATNAK